MIFYCFIHSQYIHHRSSAYTGQTVLTFYKDTPHPILKNTINEHKIPKDIFTL